MSRTRAAMYQRAGSGAQISPTVEIDEVIARYKKFPTTAASSAAAYEIEVATYDTLPLPVPTAEEREDFLLALGDARDKKLRYIQTRNDLDFAARNPEFFEDLPSADFLMSASAVYTRLINAATVHAIGLAQGQISPPRFFDPSALPTPISEPAPITLRRVNVPPPIPQVQVPDLLGAGARIPAVAHALLRQRGLNFEDSGPLQITDGPRILKGEVTAQVPVAGTTVNLGSVVRLEIGNYHEHGPIVLGHAHRAEVTTTSPLP